MITVEKLEKHFGKLQVLRGVNQHIKQGEKVVIIGLPEAERLPFYAA